MTDQSQPAMSRRRFLSATGKRVSAAAAVSVSAPALLGARSPNETIGVGCIGLGVRGGNVIYQIAGGRGWKPVEGARVMAICDVYRPHREKGVRRSNNPQARTYVDYQDILADKDVDAVVIATPDHWHSRIVIDAAKAGKDIYCEKGWTRTIPEAKAMLAAVKENKTVMQLGHQGRSRTAGVQGAQLIRDGILGPVTLVRIGRMTNGPLGRNIWRWYGEYRNFNRPDPGQVRRDLDWDRWLGPAPKVPFSMEHFWHWRCYWNYGTGAAGDLLSHEMDFVQAVLGMGIPDTCACLGQNCLLDDGREVPDTWNTIYGFEKHDCVVTFNCSMNTAEPLQPPEFRGKDAYLRFDSIAQSVSTFDVVAEPSSARYGDALESGKIKPGEPFMRFDPSKTPEQPHHMQDFLNCVRTRQKPRCNEDEAFIETATFLMSVHALREKRQVRWDPEKQDIV